MTDQLDLTVDELDVLIADVARRAPQILPVLRKVRDGAIGYVELTRAGSRILRLGPAGSRPMVVLIADPEGRGPAVFPMGFLRHLFARAGGVLLVADETDEVPYQIAAAHCAELRRHVVIIECPRSTVIGWTELAYECGVQRDNLVMFVSDPDQPEGLELLDVADVAKAPPPTGPVH
jgi:hypothetical protein